MATLITDVTDSGFNSYCSLEEALAYHETTSKAEADAWNAFDETGDDNRTRALIQATRTLDNLVRWIGYKTAPDQPLQWPRRAVPVNPDGVDLSLFADNSIPEFLKNATAELARAMFAPSAAPASDILNRIGELKAGSLQLKFRDSVNQFEDLPNKVLLMVREYGEQDVAEDDGLFGSIPFTRG